MNPWIGWGLAVVATALAWWQYGWPGVALAVSVIVFWLLLQFSRVLRTMQRAGRAPVGHVASAVMLHARLKPGLTLLQVIGLTQSLGRRVDETAAAPDQRPERWAWTDDGGVTVTLTLQGGQLQTWELTRPAE